MKTVTVLGSTGSIGRQTLEVCAKHNIAVSGAAAYKNYRLLAEQAVRFKMKKVCIFDESFLPALRDELSGTDIKILCKMEGLCELACDENADMTVNSVVGMVGLLPTLKAIEAHKDIALANKETLVAGGHLVIPAAKKVGVSIYPVDSEHSAIFQCLNGEKRSQLKKVLLTASGGPFFGKTPEQLENVTVSEALCHPNWNMGGKITVDSATMMNKGLEFMEAKWLFGLSDKQIEIVVHRQSIVHSAVEFEDGAVIAQMGVPDMKIPIQYALMYPDRFPCDVKPLSLTDIGTLTFEKPDRDTFVCLDACLKASAAGGDRPCIVNGANEAAVGLFLKERLSFNGIGKLVMRAFNELPVYDVSDYEGVCRADKAARDFVYDEVC